MGDRDLSEEEVADLKEAFAMFDINGDGMYLNRLT
jgi:Ca2+-binding EF-hand superfamily protein